jgi:hypothetical protein
MKRTFLAAAVAAAPLLAASAPVMAQVTISSATSTPVATATANNGAPADVTVSSSGSIGLTSPGTALTLNSNNNVTNAGSLGATGQNNTTGLDIVGGFTGAATNSATIDITESGASVADPNNDGLETGPFATGSDRIGILVSPPSSGPAPFVGSIINTGTITVVGNTSEGVSIQDPITGDFLSLVVTPASGSTAAAILNGSISATGQNAIGFQITRAGSIGGNARLSSITASGPGAQAVQIGGAIGGFVNVSSGIVATGYRTTSRVNNPFVSNLYLQEEMQQGGAAMTVGANIGAGLIVSSPPPIPNTTNLDQDNDGVPDSIQGAGRVVVFGASPAVQFGSAAGNPITIGAFTATNYLSPYNVAAPGQAFGFVVQGTISANGVFDQLTSPNLLAPVSATAIQVGGQTLISPLTFTFNSAHQVTATTAPVWAPTGSVTLTGGLYNSGSIGAVAYQANATAIHIGADPTLVTPTPGAVVTVPTIYNDGQILATSVQVNSATDVTVNGNGIANTPAPVPVAVTAISIEKDANVTTITNNSGILAELTGSGGVGGSTTAIIDRSGTLQNVNNSGSIQAFLNQTLATQLLPLTSPSGASNTVAIDMSAGSLPQTITQNSLALAVSSTVTPYASTSSFSVGQIVSFQGNIYVNVAAAGPGIDPVNDPTNWREIGSSSPIIAGDIYMGSGPDTLNVQAGAVRAGAITMGGALNTITVNGVAGAQTVVSGAISQRAGGAFQISVDNGSLIDTNPALAQKATTIAIGPSGVLSIAADPANGRNTQFVTSGTTTIAAGGQIGLNLQSLQVSPVQTYTVIQGAVGSISAPALGAAAVGNTPFLYSASAAVVANDPATGAAEVQLTVMRKSAADLGFNRAEAGAFDAVLNDLAGSTGTDQGIQQALLAQTDAGTLKAVYDQLLPNQGQGIFQALDAAVERIAAFVGTPPDNATHVGGASLWLQEVNERVDRAGMDTLGSHAQALGLVGGYERMGAAGGALGLSLAYFNVQENDTAAQLGARDVASIVEAGAYYRRSLGALTLALRGGGGYAWFSENRVFASGPTLDDAQANWSGYFFDGHAGAAYEVKLFGPYYARPEVSADYVRLRQNGYQEHGLNAAFNLAVSSQTSSQASAQGLMVLGRQWGRAAWFRAELRGGYREVFSGSVGDITAEFANGTPFTLSGDPDKGGWTTVGFSLKSGSEFSYLALEGDADFRRGAQRYDLRVAGRSVF